MINKKSISALLLLGLLVMLPSLNGRSFGLETAEIHGRVVDGADKPVAGADVHVFDSENVKRPADFSSARTGGDGLYRVTVPSGQYWMTAVYRADGAQFGPLGLDDKHSGEPLPINVEGGNPLEVDFTVRNLREAARMHRKENSELLTLSGRVVDGRGLPKGFVYVVADSKLPDVEVPAYMSSWTAEDGRFSLYLPIGEYQIGVVDTFPPQQMLAPTAAIKMEKSIEGFEIRLPAE